MTDFDLRNMNLSIGLTEGLNSLNLKVGIVIALDCNNLISAKSNDFNKSSWLIDIKDIIKELNISHVHGIYLTVNTLSKDGSFDLNDLLHIITADFIYIGLPDPCLNMYKIDDPTLKENINRYPDNLQKLILKQNHDLYEGSVQNIKLNSYYYGIRISKLFQKGLEKQGIKISKEELEKYKNVEKLTSHLSKKTNLKESEINQLIINTLSESFNKKYSSYDYQKDVRAISTEWLEKFKIIINKYFPNGIVRKKIINVGIGNGEEAIDLFTGCKKLSFVDIAAGGLEKVLKEFPESHIYKSRAEYLPVNDKQYELYISLRTYNSSFFNTSLALAEAYRVLKDKGIIILSVANGFLCKKNHILPGLIIPGLEFVDIYRGLNLIKSLLQECKKIGFSELQVYPSNSEIFLVGKVIK